MSLIGKNEKEDLYEHRNLTGWIHHKNKAEFEIEPAEKAEKSRIDSYFLPIINPRTMRDEGLTLLVDAVKLCAQNKIISTIPAVIAQMRRLNSAFDYGWAGVPTISDLVIFAADMKLVKVWKHNQTFVLSSLESDVSSD